MQNIEATNNCHLCDYINNSLFNNLSSEDLNQIHNHKVCIQYKKGQNIFHEGTKPAGLYCMSEGKVKVHKSNVHGKEFILYLAKPGGFLGYRALLSEEFYGATATVIEDAKICFIEKEFFFGVMNHNICFMKRIIKQLCQQRGIMEKRMADLAHKSVRERLAANLVVIKESFGVEDEKGVLLDIALSREDWAALVGTATETVIRLLSEFKLDELISFEGKKIRILNIKKLAKQADLTTI